MHHPFIAPSPQPPTKYISTCLPTLTSTLFRSSHHTISSFHWLFTGFHIPQPHHSNGAQRSPTHHASQHRPSLGQSTIAMNNMNAMDGSEFNNEWSEFFDFDAFDAFGDGMGGIDMQGDLQRGVVAEEW